MPKSLDLVFCAMLSAVAGIFNRIIPLITRSEEAYSLPYGKPQAISISFALSIVITVLWT